MDTKRCGGCGQDLPLDRYARNRNNRDGLGGWCQPCVRVAGQPWQDEHRAYLREYHRARRKAERKGTLSRDAEGRLVIPGFTTIKQANEAQTHKHCPVCDRDLELSEFYPKRGGRGHEHQCKACLSAKRKAQRAAASLTTQGDTPLTS